MTVTSLGRDLPAVSWRSLGKALTPNWGSCAGGSGLVWLWRVGRRVQAHSGVVLPGAAPNPWTPAGALRES